jgi:hypothetical protein
MPVTVCEVAASRALAATTATADQVPTPIENEVKHAAERKDTETPETVERKETETLETVERTEAEAPETETPETEER